MPPKPRPPRVQFHTSANGLAVRLAERTTGTDDWSATARQYLTEHFDLLAAALREVELTRSEALLCCETYTGTGDLLASIVDALTGRSPDLRDDVDSEALTAKVMGWAPWQRAAVADAIHRWRLQRAASVPSDDALEDVGLVRPHALPE